MQTLDYADQKCRDCRHWFKHDLQDHGDCRAIRPDVILLGTGQVAALFPVTNSSFQACGMFRRRPLAMAGTFDPEHMAPIQGQ